MATGVEEARLYGLGERHPLCSRLPVHKSQAMPTLFDPFVLGATALANRIVMAPLTRDRAGPGQVPTPMMAEYYRQRARCRRRCW